LKDRSQQKFKETFTSRSPSFVFLFGREKEEIKLGKQHVAYKKWWRLSAFSLPLVNKEVRKQLTILATIDLWSQPFTIPVTSKCPPLTNRFFL
jgi:hypothetical protein